MRTPLATFALIWLAVLVTFIVMAAFASAHDTFSGDIWAARRIQDIEGLVPGRALDWTEDVTDFPVVAFVYAIFAITLAVVAGPRSTLLVPGALLGRALNSGLKEIIERPRPDQHLIDVTEQPSTFSFPSGHTGGAFVLYGLIFYFATVYIPNPRLRRVVQAICTWIIVLTGIERVYTGHHWPSDVIGGILYGALVLSLLIALHRIFVVGRRE